MQLLGSPHVFHMHVTPHCCELGKILGHVLPSDLCTDFSPLNSMGVGCASGECLPCYALLPFQILCLATVCPVFGAIHPPNQVYVTSLTWQKNRRIYHYFNRFLLKSRPYFLEPSLMILPWEFQKFENEHLHLSTRAPCLLVLVEQTVVISQLIHHEVWMGPMPASPQIGTIWRPT